MGVRASTTLGGMVVWIVEEGSMAKRVDWYYNRKG
jgi:hypothetical protein